MIQSEVKNLSVAELQQKLGEYKKAYADMKIAHAITPLENPLSIRKTRRTIARLASELTRRELQ